MAARGAVWMKVCMWLWLVLAATASDQLNVSSRYHRHTDPERTKEKGSQGEPSIATAIRTASKDVQSLAALLEEFYGKRSLEERMALVRFLNKRAKQRSAKLEAVVDTALSAYRIIAPFALMRMALRWKTRVKHE